MSKLNPAFERVADKAEQRRRQERMRVVFEAEKAEAAYNARCMGCDTRTKFFASGRGKYLCGDPECTKYYQQLYAEAHKARRNEQQFNRYWRKKHDEESKQS